MLKRENALYNNPRETRNGICTEQDELGEERGEGEKEASHPELGVSSVLYLCVCVFIYMWVYKTMKGLNFYESRQRVNQRKLFWIQNLRHDYGLNRIWNRR